MVSILCNYKNIIISLLGIFQVLYLIFAFFFDLFHFINEIKTLKLLPKLYDNKSTYKTIQKEQRTMLHSQLHTSIIRRINKIIAINKTQNIKKMNKLNLNLFESNVWNNVDILSTNIIYREFKKKRKKKQQRISFRRKKLRLIELKIEQYRKESINTVDSEIIYSHRTKDLMRQIEKQSFIIKLNKNMFEGLWLGFSIIFVTLWQINLTHILEFGFFQRRNFKLGFLFNRSWNFIVAFYGSYSFIKRLSLCFITIFICRTSILFGGMTTTFGMVLFGVIEYYGNDIVQDLNGNKFIWSCLLTMWSLAHIFISIITEHIIFQLKCQNLLMLMKNWLLYLVFQISINLAFPLVCSLMPFKTLIKTQTIHTP
jgi:hypothetical protein